jgi:hypothetical protein
VGTDLGKNTFISINLLEYRAQIAADIDTVKIGPIAFQRMIVQLPIKRIV